jgi:ATP-binding cassette, subfamily C, bacterial PrsD
MAALITLALHSSPLTARNTEEIASALMKRNKLGEAAFRNAEAIAAMGVLSRATRRWDAVCGHLNSLQQRNADVAGLITGVSQTLLQVVQAMTGMSFSTVGSTLSMTE